MSKKVVIITALPLEYKAVKSFINNCQEALHPSGTIYEEGEYQHWKIGLAEIGQGDSKAAVETGKAIQFFNPDYVFFVGVAGGIKDVNLGDVVIAEVVKGYEKGNETDAGFLSRGEVGQSDFALIQRAKATAKNAWFKNLNTEPNALIGVIAAGEKVVASEHCSTYERLMKLYSDALAVEMEGIGFLTAIRANNAKGIVIRGISDLLSNKTESDKSGWQEKAAHHAAAFVFSMLEKLSLDITRDETVNSSSKVDLTGINGEGKTYSDVISYVNEHKIKYFYPEDLIKLFLSIHDFKEKKGNTKFIKYDNAYKYYSGDRAVFCLVNGEDSNFVEIPYKEEINFIKNPETLMTVEREIAPYKMPEDIFSLTEGNLKSYLEANSKTTDGSILRIASLEKRGVSKYICKLEASSYFYQVRTNLTLDYPLKDPLKKYHERPLRLLDSTKNSRLPDFDKSIMVNSIGVSAVLYYRNPSSGERAFFLKPRKGERIETKDDKNKESAIGVGVFQNMLGIVSGVAEVPASGRITDIVQYAESEIFKELIRETGYSNDQKPIIKPLAFVRELARGGKPQFFFLIEIPYINDKDFRKKFRESIEGLEEFVDGKSNKRLDFKQMLSPEAAANLLYALSYFESS
jgi:nucleoside phosphorylase